MTSPSRSQPGNASELLPCPFCGESDVGFGRTGQKWQTVACNECGAEGPCTEIERDLIIRKWNTRAPAQCGVQTGDERIAKLQYVKEIAALRAQERQ